MKDISIRIKLLILVLVSILPMIVLHSHVITTNHEDVIKSELKSNQDYAEAISTAFINYLESIWSSEMVISMHITGNTGLETSQVNKYLRDCISGYPTSRSFSWAGPDGMTAFSSNPEEVGTKISEFGLYRRIASGEEKVLSDIIINKSSRIPAIIIARGIRENGELKGIVYASIDVNKIGSVLPLGRLGETSSFGLIDRNGMMAFRHGTSDTPIEKLRISDDSFAWKALRGEIAKSTGHNSIVDNSSRMGVSFPVPNTGWASFATISTAEVLKQHNSETLSSIITMLIIALISLITALYLVVDLIKPIDKLQRTAKAISSRDFSFRTNIERKDELGQTGAVFDQMAEHIQELENSRLLFLQIAAHELRNPMTSIKGIASLIHIKTIKGKPINNFMQLLETLENEVDRLARLINQVLEAFRSERHNVHMKQNMKPVDIRDIVNSAVKLYEMDTGNNRSIINNCLDSMYVMGDFERLEDVIRNLVSNAIKYSSEMTEIKIDTCKEGDNVIISVKDQGLGIPEDKLDRIFDSFYRVNNMFGKDPGGLGLGLYICKDIILRHGGSIWAENNSDAGSTFYIKLPLYKG